MDDYSYLIREEPYFPEKVLAVVSMRRRGYSYRDIGDALGCTRMNACLAFKRWKDWGDKQLADRAADREVNMELLPQ